LHAPPPPDELELDELELDELELDDEVVGLLVPPPPSSSPSPLPTVHAPAATTHAPRNPTANIQDFILLPPVRCKTPQRICQRARALDGDSDDDSRLRDADLSAPQA
jgi:hypothetical protein